MSKPTFLLFPFGLAPADARIGRFVSNPYAPQVSYSPEEPSVSKGCLSDKDQVSAKTFLKSMQEKKIQGSLTSLFEAKYSKSGQTKITLESSYVHTTILRNSENELSRLLGRKSTREWIKRNGGHKLYLITGIKVIRDGKVSVERNSETKTQFKGHIPVTALLTHGAAPAAGVDTLDVKVEPMKSNRNTLQTTFDAAGDTIFAVEYRELIYKGVFGRKHLDKVHLAYATTLAGDALFYGADLTAGGTEGEPNHFEWMIFVQANL